MIKMTDTCKHKQSKTEVRRSFHWDFLPELVG